MPRRNGTGPLGEGSMTGKGMGNCQSVKPSRIIGRGYRNGRRCQSFQWSKEDLEFEKAMLEKRIEEINQSLKE